MSKKLQQLFKLSAMKCEHDLAWSLPPTIDAFVYNWINYHANLSVLRFVSYKIKDKHIKIQYLIFYSDKTVKTKCQPLMNVTFQQF